MSVFGLERSPTGAANDYDHAISLIDTTKPKESFEDDSAILAPPEIPQNDGDTNLSRQWTKVGGTLRKELTRRKYAKYQEGKAEIEGSPNRSDNDNDEPRPTGSRSSQDGKGPADARRRDRLLGKVPFRAKKKIARASQDTDAFIDVLYENQRGSFFCGIPLYSSSSLLNFDPAAWQTADFQDSAVNITNAQVPDPSWTWAWKTWYVDMSRDVDEEGWEYSFSFNKAYAWHGSQPWLFSFVRRRRWLKKRVRVHPRSMSEKKGMGKQPHMLTEDYFTIHIGKKERSRESSADRTTMNRSSFTNGYKGDEEPDLSDIANISALMAALKVARVDREKTAAIKAFLNQGGDELFYLPESIPAIMAEFIYQTSRRQLQSYLLQTLDETLRSEKATEGTMKGKDRETSDSDSEARKRKIENLSRTIQAAGVSVDDLNDRTESRPRVSGIESEPTNAPHVTTKPAKPDNKNDDDPHAHSEDDEPSVREEIRGIPEDAHVLEEPRIGSMDKGKGRA